MRLLLITLVLMALSATAAAGPTVTLRFNLFYNGIKIADMTDTFLPAADGTYVLHSHAAAIGLAKILHGDITRRSQGRLDVVDGLQMQRYEETRGHKEPQMAILDETAGILTLTRGDEQREEAVILPVFDYLTALYRFYVLGAVTGGTVPTTNGWRFKTYDYTVGTPVAVETGIGTVQAIPMRRHSERGERVFWLAPALNFLPVRSRIDDKGHVFESVLVDNHITREKPQ